MDRALKRIASRYLAIVFLSFLSAEALEAQDCTDYHYYHCVYADYTYFYSRQSKSLLSGRGQTSEIQMVAYGGEEYYVAVCAHRRFAPVRFRILEDIPSKTVLYDNATNQLQPSISFVNEATRNLIIELSVSEGQGKESKEFRCVGVVIQFRKVEGN